MSIKDKFYMFFEQYKSAEASIREHGDQSHKTRDAFERANKSMVELVGMIEEADRILSVGNRQ